MKNILILKNIYRNDKSDHNKYNSNLNKINMIDESDANKENRVENTNKIIENISDCDIDNQFSFHRSIDRSFSNNSNSSMSFIECENKFKEKFKYDFNTPYKVFSNDLQNERNLNSNPSPNLKSSEGKFYAPGKILYNSLCFKIVHMYIGFQKDTPILIFIIKIFNNEASWLVKKNFNDFKLFFEDNPLFDNQKWLFKFTQKKTDIYKREIENYMNSSKRKEDNMHLQKLQGFILSNIMNTSVYFKLSNSLILKMNGVTTICKVTIINKLFVLHKNSKYGMKISHSFNLNKSLANIILADDDDTSTWFKFILHYDNISYTFFSLSYQERNMWVKTLRIIINNE